MNIFIRIIQVLSAISLLSGCSQTTVVHHNPSSEMGLLIRDLEKAENDYLLRSARQNYLATAKAFVSRAQAEDVKGMLRLTSPLTLRASGSVQVERVYREQVVPQLAGKSISWEPQMEDTQDETGNRGLICFARVAGSTPIRTSVTVMEEGGHFYVITLKAKRL